MKTTPLAELEYYDEGATILTDWEAEEFVMNRFGYEMSNDIEIVFISGISRGIYVGENAYAKNQPMWDAYEYAKQYDDSIV
jgi:hypothetical protein